MINTKEACVNIVYTYRNAMRNYPN